MRNYFPERTSAAPLHTLSKLYDVPVGFVSPSFVHLRSPKGGCCSISDDLSCLAYSYSEMSNFSYGINIWP